MKIYITYGFDEEGHANLLMTIKTKCGYRNDFGVGAFNFCPEDANLERDLNFVYEIPEMLRKAYEAGKNGEDFVIEEEEEAE